MHLLQSGVDITFIAIWLPALFCLYYGWQETRRDGRTDAALSDPHDRGIRQRLPCLEDAVLATTAISCKRASGLIRGATSNPSIPGNWTSTSTRSGRNVRSVDRACSAVAAIWTLSPSFRRMLASSFRVTAASSTIRIVLLAINKGPPWSLMKGRGDSN